MNTLHAIWTNTFLREAHARRRGLLLERIPELKRCSHNHFLCLFDYLARSPERFFSPSVYHKYLSHLEAHHSNQPAVLSKYLQENEAELNRAFLFLAEINRYDWHDSLERPDDYENIRFIDQTIHPTYLRLIEAVFLPFVHLPAFLSVRFTKFIS